MAPTQVSDGVYEIAANFDDAIKIPYIVAETDTGGPFVHALVTSVPCRHIPLSLPRPDLPARRAGDLEQRQRRQGVRQEDDV
jgi:hypothetical protein